MSEQLPTAASVAVETPVSVEMPRPTIAPLFISLGVAFAAAGLATSLVLCVVGISIAVTGIVLWTGQLLPGRGHIHEPLVAADLRPAPVVGQFGLVEQIRTGMPGYRLRLPEKMHPISAGVKGGIIGGLVMPAPAMLYGLISGHGVWYPANLLAGMLLPGVDTMTTAELEQFHPTLLLIGLTIHIVVSVVFGLLYGVLLPMLPKIPKAWAWGALLMPLLWTGISFGSMSFVNPALSQRVDWPWFIVSQFVFGSIAAGVVAKSARHGSAASGILAGFLGGVVMPVPAVLWSIATGHGIWYVGNLLAGVVISGLDQMPTEQLEHFNANWLTAAVSVHAVICIALGLVYGLLLPRLPSISGALAWGGMLLPLLWTATSYSLMGVLNPLLQQRVDWAWFIISQFVFGVAAAIVVERTEQIYLQPAGSGPTPTQPPVVEPPPAEGPS